MTLHLEDQTVIDEADGVFFGVGFGSQYMEGDIVLCTYFKPTDPTVLNNITCKDTFATDMVVPPDDSQQDIFDVTSMQSEMADGKATMVVLKRLLTTNDSQDYQMIYDAMHLIFGHGIAMGGVPQPYDTTQRGLAKIILNYNTSRFLLFKYLNQSRMMLPSSLDT